MLLLRESSRDPTNLNLSAATGETGRGTGVPHGDTLVAFVDAVLADDDDARVAARRAVLDAVGPAGLVDVAAVIAAFTLQNRIADATGTPLDAPIELATRSLRAEIGADRFATAASTRKGGWLRALLARLVERLLPLALRLAGRKKQGIR